jgi:DNA (cytosine-5)-methyltransferase 1
MLTSRGLGTVLGDLAAMGFDAKWGVLGAADIGANHQRDRIWIVGKNTNTSNKRLEGK